MQRPKEGHTKGRTLSFAVIFLLTGVFVAGPRFAHAASLYLNPSSGSFSVGSTISVDVIVDTKGESINAVSGKIVYPKDVLKPVSVNKDNSIVTLWLEQPGVSATNSTVSFEGLILNPGFNGVGNVVTVRFEVTAAGPAVIEFASGLALSNDGFGTNLLETLADASYNVDGSLGVIAKQPKTEELPIDPNLLVVGILRPPVVTNYTNRPRNIGEFFVQGVTYPKVPVKVWIQSAIETDPELYTVVSDEAGNFAYRYDNPEKEETPLVEAAALPGLTGVANVLKSVRGTPHRFWLAAVVNGVETPPTQAFEISVGGLGIPEMLLMVIILLILGVFALLMFEMIMLRKVYAHDHEDRFDHLQHAEVSPRPPAGQWPAT